MKLLYDGIKVRWVGNVPKHVVDLYVINNIYIYIHIYIFIYIYRMSQNLCHELLLVIPHP